MVENSKKSPRTIKKLLLIPTIKHALSETSLCSFRTSLARTSTTAVVVYNGSDESVVSDFSHGNVIRIGFQDSAELAKRFAEIAGCPEELLFGKQEYNRSYGGASNLLIAVGYALGASIMGKVDDDLWDLSHTRTDSWLSVAMEIAKPKKIYFGPYCNNTSTVCLSKLPQNTASELAEHIYSENERAQRIAGEVGLSSNVVLNGNLVFEKYAAASACYAVLYDTPTRTHVRGEVYYWMYDQQERGLSFEYEKALYIEHRNSKDVRLMNWLRSIVVGFDLSLVFRTYKEQDKKVLTALERREALADFRSWILETEWPEEVNSEELANLLDEYAFNFTEKFYSELQPRKLAWSRLTSSDLRSVIADVLPALWKDRS